MDTMDSVIDIIVRLQDEENIQNYLYKYWRDEIAMLYLYYYRYPQLSNILGYQITMKDRLPQYLERDFFDLFRMTMDTLLSLLTQINCAERLFISGEEQNTI